MEEMVEPDRTIMIVSIIGLVVIWGSFFYHKFVQGGTQAPEAESAAEVPQSAVTGGPQRAKKKNKKKR